MGPPSHKLSISLPYLSVPYRYTPKICHNLPFFAPKSVVFVVKKTPAISHQDRALAPSMHSWAWCGILKFSNDWNNEGFCFELRLKGRRFSWLFVFSPGCLVSKNVFFVGCFLHVFFVVCSFCLLFLFVVWLWDHYVPPLTMFLFVFGLTSFFSLLRFRNCRFRLDVKLKQLFLVQVGVSTTSQIDDDEIDETTSKFPRKFNVWGLEQCES